MDSGVSAARPSPRRTPQAREEYRKSLYKSSPSPWRITYEKVCTSKHHSLRLSIKLVPILICVHCVSQRCRERLKESRSKFLERFRAISSESTNDEPPLLGADGHVLSPGHGAVAMATDKGATPVQGISNEVIRSSVEEVMRKEWESMREEHSSLPQLPPADRPRRKGWATNGTSFNCEDPMDGVSVLNAHYIIPTDQLMRGACGIVNRYIHAYIFVEFMFMLDSRASALNQMRWSVYSVSWMNLHRSL